MRSLYKITNRKGVTLCFQVDTDPKSAIDTAKMYGHRSAAFAEFVRED